jgi:hypothetical protein
MSQKKEGPGPPITRRRMLAQTAKGAALASLVPLTSTQTLLAETTQLQGAKTGAQSTKPGHPTAKLIALETEKLKLSVDSANCRWSAQLKGSEMQLNDVHFLPADDPSGWTVTSSVNRNDSSNLGSFESVTLRGTKHGQLDFEYRISASKAGNDILVSLGRANHTGKPVVLQEMDYFVSSDARLGGTTDKWVSLGTHSRNRDYLTLPSECVSLSRPGFED